LVGHVVAHLSLDVATAAGLLDVSPPAARAALEALADAGILRYRHGPLPGPRSLGAATRLTLLAIDSPLALDVVDFCLKRFGYRCNISSLRNAVNQLASGGLA